MLRWHSGVVSYRNSTSNHNCKLGEGYADKLYLIEILHQTTTAPPPSRVLTSCILSKFYIKPQQPLTLIKIRGRCILSKFYIKPQQLNWEKEVPVRCILSKFYIKPQRSCWPYLYRSVVSYRNSTSNHNDVRSNPLAVPVVSYRNSTSNHNHLR